MSNTIGIPYTYEPEDDDLDYEEVIMEVDYDYDRMGDDFYITGFQCESSPEAAKAAAKEYANYKSNWYDIVNEKIRDYIDNAE